MGTSRVFLDPPTSISPAQEITAGAPNTPRGPAAGGAAPGPAGTHPGAGRGARRPGATVRRPNTRPPASAAASSASPCWAREQAAVGGVRQARGPQSGTRPRPSSSPTLAPPLAPPPAVRTQGRGAGVPGLCSQSRLSGGHGEVGEAGGRGLIQAAPPAPDQAVKRNSCPGREGWRLGGGIPVPGEAPPLQFALGGHPPPKAKKPCYGGGSEGQPRSVLPF